MGEGRGIVCGAGIQEQVSKSSRGIYAGSLDRFIKWLFVQARSPPNISILDELYL